MAKTINIEINDESHEYLQKMASKNDLSVSNMCKYILEEFCFQGNVHTGDWREGPGIRILIDYPKYSSRVIKVKKEDMA